MRYNIIAWDLTAKHNSELLVDGLSQISKGK